MCLRHTMGGWKKRHEQQVRNGNEAAELTYEAHCFSHPPSNSAHTLHDVAHAAEETKEKKNEKGSAVSTFTHPSFVPIQRESSHMSSALAVTDDLLCATCCSSGSSSKARSAISDQFHAPQESKQATLPARTESKNSARNPTHEPKSDRRAASQPQCVQPLLRSKSQ